jgi:hypothetical protein
MWTIQEVALARQVIFMCGAATIEWEELDMGKEILGLRQTLGQPFGPEDAAFSNALACQASFRNLLRQRRKAKPKDSTPAPPELSTLLHHARQQEATDPKDVIYGIYGLLSALGIELPTPNYSKSIEQIYTETAKAAILQNNDLELLYQVSSRRKKLPDLRSWVPCFNEQCFYWASWTPNLFNCSKNSKSEFQFQEGRTLSLVGKCVDRITACSKYFPLYEGTNGYEDFFLDNRGIDPNAKDRGFLGTYRPMVRAFREWCGMAASLKSYPTGETATEALCRTLVHDRVIREDRERRKWDLESYSTGFENWYAAITAETRSGPLSLENLDGYLAAAFDLPTNWSTKRNLQELFNASEKLNPSAVTDTLTYKIVAVMRMTVHTSTYENMVIGKIVHSRFMTTRDGYMGTVPPNAQVGDYVFLVSGLSLPMIIRREGGVNTLIGPAYVHGIMDGERWPVDKAELEMIIFC